MCLLAIAVGAHPSWPLVIAANRDEFYARPTARAGWWVDAPQVFGGRDLEHGGTWLGVTRHGRIAALTNFRDPAAVKRDAPSRGLLVSGFLRGQESPRHYLEGVRGAAGSYNHFNLVVGESGRLWCLESRTGSIRELTAGVHGLSNALLDTPWPKVERLKTALASHLAAAAAPDPATLFGYLADCSVAAEAALPHTGIAPDLERALSAAFIRLPQYGTRCSTVIGLDDRGRFDIAERSFDASGPLTPDIRTGFVLASG